jgi:hypothetical protein
VSVKFACDRCGKRFASVDEPRPGRVYRIRCRCGNVVVLRPAPAAARVEDAASASAPKRARSAWRGKREARHVPVSRPRPPPLPAGGAAEGVREAPPARVETPVEVLEPIGEPTLAVVAPGGEREPTFEPLPAPEAPASGARVDSTPTIEPLPAPPAVPAPRVDTTPTIEPIPAPPPVLPGRVDMTPTIEPIAAPAPPSLKVEPTPPAATPAGEPTPPILDDPFARAAEEEAREADGTAAPAQVFALVPREAVGAEETPVELSRSESFAVRGLGGLFRDVGGAPGLGGIARRHWIAVAAALVAAAAVAAVVALR